MERTQFLDNCTEIELPPGLKTRLDKNQVTEMAFSPDGTRLAAGGAGRIWVYDADSGAQFAMLPGHTDRIRALAFAPDSRLLATASDDNTLRLWDTDTAREVPNLTVYSNFIQAFGASREGTAPPAQDKGTAHLPGAFSDAPEDTGALAFAPDSTALASGSADGKIRLWELETGRMQFSLPTDQGGVLALAFSPERKILASGGSDTLVRLWDVDSRRLLSTLTGHTGSVNALAFSIDGEILASGGRDAHVRLWDVGAGSLMSTLPARDEAVWELAFIEKKGVGQRLCVCAEDGSLLIME